MTLRLTDEEADALRAEAERSGRSMQDLARTAVREFVARRGQRHLVDEELEHVVTTYADALRRLGE
jgi:predicted transcriptional regulator